MTRPAKKYRPAVKLWSRAQELASRLSGQRLVPRLMAAAMAIKRVSLEAYTALYSVRLPDPIFRAGAEKEPRIQPLGAPSKVGIRRLLPLLL